MSYSLVCPIPDEIDRIDNRILDLLGQRKDIVSKVSDVKRRHQLKVLDRTREASLLEDRRLRCENLGLRKEVIESLYRVVLTASRDHQAASPTDSSPLSRAPAPPLQPVPNVVQSVEWTLEIPIRLKWFSTSKQPPERDRLAV
ncbi:MAG: chorismate mutase [Myxococcota bacterium]|nr:chorismate mutase [Myxococcota bacterium]